MARVRNSAAAAKARRSRPVSARTAARRARAAQAEQAQKETSKTRRKEPETIIQARVWERKCNRYILAGLCEVCASAAAWGHAEGFGTLERAGRVPCADCQPFVSKFPKQAFRGSKWFKILDKLEYMDAETLEIWLDAHWPFN